jgi:hypothetical protein
MEEMWSNRDKLESNRTNPDISSHRFKRQFVYDEKMADNILMMHKFMQLT